MIARLENTPVLETERLILRAPEVSDVPVMEPFLASTRSQYMRAEEVSPEYLWCAVAQTFGMWVYRGYGPFVLVEKSTGKPVGDVGPWHPTHWPEAEIGWSIWDEAAEGKGYAFEAALATRAYAYGALGWRTAVSYIHPENARSIALAQRLGATLDADADRVDPEDLVYRHPAPEALQ